MVRCLAGFWVLVLGPIATWGWDQEAQSGPILVTHGRSEYPIIIFPRFILGIYIQVYYLGYPANTGYQHRNISW